MLSLSHSTLQSKMTFKWLIENHFDGDTFFLFFFFSQQEQNSDSDGKHTGLLRQQFFWGAGEESSFLWIRPPGSSVSLLLMNEEAPRGSFVS